MWNAESSESEFLLIDSFIFNVNIYGCRDKMEPQEILDVEEHVDRR